MLPPGIDTSPCSRLIAAFCGSHWADDEDRAEADRLERLAPGCGDLIRGAREFHANAARRHVAWRGVAGGIICGGLPAEPEAYRGPDGQVLSGRWVLADPVEKTTVSLRWGLDEDEARRVTAVQGAAVDPAGILSRPEVRAIGGPVTVHSRMGAQFWPPGDAAEAVAGWGRLLPAGSAFCLSLWLPARTEAGREMAAAMEGRECTVQGHAERDVEAWFAGAPRLTVRRSRVRRCAAGSVMTVAASAGC